MIIKGIRYTLAFSFATLTGFLGFMTVHIVYTDNLNYYAQHLPLNEKQLLIGLLIFVPVSFILSLKLAPVKEEEAQ